MALFYQPSKATEIVLTTLFGLEVAAIFAALLQGRLAAGCPVSSLMAAAALAGCCLLVAPMIKLVKLVSGVVGASVSRTLLAKDPLGKFRTRTKYEDQCWQLWIHATMTALEVYTIFYDGGGEPWMREYKSFWVPHPREQVHTKASLHALYLVQTAIWIATCFSHQFLEQRHKDYVMMYLHHLVTIALLLLSYSWGYLRIGAMVLLWFYPAGNREGPARTSPLEKRPPGGLEAPDAPVHSRAQSQQLRSSRRPRELGAGRPGGEEEVCCLCTAPSALLTRHDSSDIVIDLLKITNYMKLEGPRHLFLVELCFITNLFTWGYARLYLYGYQAQPPASSPASPHLHWRARAHCGYQVVFVGGLIAPREMYLSPGSPNIGWAKTVTAGHRPGWKYPDDIGDGSFGAAALWENIRSVPTHENIPGWWVFNSLMVALIVMHVIWYLMFWRMLFRLIGGETGHEAGKEEYEGDSDDE